MRSLILIVSITAALFGASNDIQVAYEKEFAFLKEQKLTLEKRLKRVEQDNSAKLKTAQDNIKELQAKLMRLDTQVDMQLQKLIKAERDEQDVKDNSQITHTTLMQAKSTLKPFGISIDEKASNKAKELARAFDEAIGALKTSNSITRTTGEFFLSDSSKVEGDIIKIGNIASYGISTNNAVALAPAGDGAFKAWDMPAKDSALAMQNSTPTDVLAMFVYENSDQAVEAATKKTVLSVINSGGAIGWVIVVLGFAALILALLRGFFLKSADSNTTKIRTEVAVALIEEGENKALEVCKKSKGATARVLATTIRNIDKERDHLEDLVAESVLHENNYLDRFGTAIMVIAAVAPLLGLLGTVTGMISTFDVITEFGTGDPKMLSGGISEALVTTELGLIVAIPALLVGNLLSGWAERIKDGMEQAALNITNVYLNR